MGLSIVSCTNVVPLDFDDMAQDSLLTMRDELKWADEKSTYEKNLADSAAMAEANAANRARYLADLNAYKASDHILTFGWFNGWNPNAPDKEFSLDNLPDSVDWVSNWGASWNLDQKKKDELARAHERGIRMTIGWIIENVGQGLTAPEGGWLQYKGADGKVDPFKAIDQYVKMLCDSIQKYNYDGMDVDYEPSFASPFKNGNHCGDWNENDLVDHIALISCSAADNKERENYFFNRMREELDKRSDAMGKPLMFNINGSLSWIDPAVVEVFDFYVAQSYHQSQSGWVNVLDKYVNMGLDLNPSKQLLVTETFENNDKNADGFAENYARYAVEHGNVAGIGAYHINADWRWGPKYQNLRDAINVLSPSYIPE